MWFKKKVNVRDEFVEAVEIVKLNVQKMHHVAREKEQATELGALIIVVGGVAKFVGEFLFSRGYLFPPSANFLFMQAILQVAAVYLAIWVTDWIARKQGGKGTYQEFFRVAAFGSIVLWSTVLPPIAIVSLWWLVILAVSVKEIHKLELDKAIISVGGGIASAVVLYYIVMQASFGSLGWYF